MYSLQIIVTYLPIREAVKFLVLLSDWDLEEAR
jgi:hypothetical protein